MQLSLLLHSVRCKKGTAVGFWKNRIAEEKKCSWRDVRPTVYALPVSNQGSLKLMNSPEQQMASSTKTKARRVREISLASVVYSMYAPYSPKKLGEVDKIGGSNKGIFCARLCLRILFFENARSPQVIEKLVSLPMPCFFRPGFEIKNWVTKISRSRIFCSELC